MEFILQALTYKSIGKIIYRTAHSDLNKALADFRAMIAQHVDAIVTYPDYADAELPNEYSQWESRLHPEERSRVHSRFREHLEGGSAGYRDEFRMRHRDGSWRRIRAMTRSLTEAMRYDWPNRPAPLST